MLVYDRVNIIIRLYRLVQMKIILAKKDRAEKFLTWN